MMTEEITPEPSGKYLKLDESAQSASDTLPAFLARPEGAPVYHGFPLVPETCIDGWCYGAITDFEEYDPIEQPDGCDYGDGYVIAPDGSLAGLVWDVGEEPMKEIRPPEPGRWGVYQVWFPRGVKNLEDLKVCFAHILPELKAKYAELHQ